MVSTLASVNQVAQVAAGALAGDIYMLCSWVRHFTLSASLHPGV